MLLLTINLELEICKKLDLSYNIVHILFLNQYPFIKIVILFLIFMHLSITSNFFLFLNC